MGNEFESTGTDMSDDKNSYRHRGAGQIYREEMGSIELLTEEAETELAERIQNIRQKALNGLCDVPLTLKIIGGWYEKMGEGTLPLPEIIEVVPAKNGDSKKEEKEAEEDQFESADEEDQKEPGEAKKDPQGYMEKCRAVAVACKAFSLEQAKHYEVLLGGDTLSQEEHDAYEKQGTDLVALISALRPKDAQIEKLIKDLAEFARIEGAPAAAEIARLPLDKFKDILPALQESVNQLVTAKNEMAEANLRLVCAIARGYANRGVPVADLVQEANIGLMRAVDKFDHTRVDKFSNYAAWWIRETMIRAIADQRSAIRVPVHRHDDLRNLRRAQENIKKTTGKTPTVDELAEALDMPPGKVKKLLAIPAPPTSLDAIVGDGDTPLGHFVEDKKAENPFNLVVSRQGYKLVTKWLATLIPREERILRLHYGIGTEAQTLEQIGPIYGVSRERIRQIETQAFRNLRKPRNRRLAGFPKGEYSQAHTAWVASASDILSVREKSNKAGKPSQALNSVPFLVENAPILLAELERRDIHTRSELARAMIQKGFNQKHAFSVMPVFLSGRIIGGRHGNVLTLAAKFIAETVAELSLKQAYPKHFAAPGTPEVDEAYYAKGENHNTSSSLPARPNPHQEADRGTSIPSASPSL